MSNIDIITMALRNLWKRKLRTFLTILGVIVGTAAIVVMISIGLGINESFDEQLRQMGDITRVTVYSPDQYGGGGGRVYASGGGMVMESSRESGMPAQKDVKLDKNAIQAFKGLPGVVAATPVLELYLNFKSGKYIGEYLRVVGMDPEAMTAMGYAAETGRNLESTDKLEVLFGNQTAFQFYRQNSRPWMNQNMPQEEPEAPINPLVDRLACSYDWRMLYPNDYYDDIMPEVKIYNVRGIGTLVSTGDYSIDYSVFMNIDELTKIKAAQQRFEQGMNQQWSGARAPNNNDSGYQLAYVKCGDLKTVKKVHQMILDMGYPAEIPSQQLEAMQKSADMLQRLLGAIGAVSLFVAAIGIANTMIMAIYERTREIGVMKVIGAMLADIRKLFLLEAAMIGFIGGGFGIGLSLLISYILNITRVSFMGTISEYMATTQSNVSLITPWLCGLALVFATVVGLVSGYFPARRAMQVSALTAIRTD